MERLGSKSGTKRALPRPSVRRETEILSREQDAHAFARCRWTAKEAAYKALYPALVPRWADLTVSKQGPKPTLSWSTSAPNFVRPPTVDPDRVRLHLSVSHDADLMVAYVVAELLDKRTWA